MAAAKMLDLVASLPGNRGGQTDAARAYTQALLQGTETRIRIPNDRWPPSWNKMRDPVVPLRLALYGHPDSGTFWERHCEERLLQKSFITIPGWPGVFTHESLRVVLAVYVDDFKLAGAEKDMDKASKVISDAVSVEPPTAMGR